MAKFYDSTTYPPAGTILGDEVFIIYQSGQSRTTNFDAVLESLIHPLIDNIFLDDIVDVTITNPTNDDILVYSDGEWVNVEAGLASITEIQDVTVLNPQDGQMLIWDGLLWGNGNDPELTNYTETEHNIGSISGSYTINLENGNVQRLQIGGSVVITLPLMPPTGQNWHLTLKVIYNGSDVPTFTSPDGTLKWQGGTVPSDLGLNNSMNIYTFTSDFTSSEIYGSIVWNEE